MRTYEFRLYPNREQHRRLSACLIESRQIYNEMLACEKQHYQETGTFLNRYDLNKRFAGRGQGLVPFLGPGVARRDLGHGNGMLCTLYQQAGSMRYLRTAETDGIARLSPYAA